MSAKQDAYDAALAAAGTHARAWLSTLPTRAVPPSADADSLAAAVGGPLPEDGLDPGEVVELLARSAEPGLMAMPAGRFFGWVIGGTLPAALGADWLVSAWDQNAAMRYPTPATAALEEVAGAWILDLLGLPAGCDVGFVTGATMANFTGLAAARRHVLARRGWDVDFDGLFGAPRIRVLVGDERHDTLDLALRYLGLGAPTPIAADDQGRIRLDALAEALGSGSGEPTIVCLQAGNVHSGAFDAVGEAADLAHRHGAWVHVDGAFGLWAAAAPDLRHLVPGLDRADSWATDGHKTLNVPYDCGIVIVRDPAALRSAMGVEASYLIEPAGPGGPADPFEKVPELSRRARGVPVWAALRSLGRRGVAEMVSGFAANARRLAEGIAGIDGAEVLNDVVFTQVCATFGDDTRTAAVTRALLSEGRAWMSGSRWRGRTILRVSVSNWSTDTADVEESLAALRRAAAAA
ncbi:aspartate aminotransferase family protein [Dactylosporangium vinaceum]|uniref:Pyridoxal phosphate-dependent decarboxylase family protein n=1 Tax=Dactylosporangium vinaceum TaxID=53362 RepID=A0ABV5M244_9ACTN|nr:aminotransferase class V-fold PLP-dependent enzyme [Dactylosporangium vinaceum]UAB99406.1 aspartate aminotransferase family protein [Dactylosporangium vinaceum]